MCACKSYSIHEVRKKLGSIVSDIFTDSYNLKYHVFMVGLGDDPQPLYSAMTTYSSEINITIGKLYYSSRISEEEVNKVVENTSPSVLACIFYRYHFLTRYLSSVDQDSVLSFPADPEHFFLELLVNYWKEACQHISL